MMEATPSVTHVQTWKKITQTQQKTAQTINSYEDMIIGTSSEADSDYNPEDEGNSQGLSTLHKVSSTPNNMEEVNINKIKRKIRKQKNTEINIKQRKTKKENKLQRQKTNNENGSGQLTGKINQKHKCKVSSDVKKDAKANGNHHQTGKKVGQNGITHMPRPNSRANKC